MLGNFSMIDNKNDSAQRETEKDSVSGGSHESTNTNEEGFRSRLNTNSSENIAMTAETATSIYFGLVGQMFRK